MSEIKQEIQAVSGWLEYELNTKMLEPPSIKLKIAPINRMEYVDDYDVKAQGIKPLTTIVINRILRAVRDWDLTLKGKKLPVTEDNKRDYLIPLLGEQVKGKGKTLLGFELFTFASDLENFLKN